MHKVLFVSHLYPQPHDPLYGMVVHRQAVELKKAGCDIRVLSPVLNIPKSFSKLKKKWNNNQNIESERIFEGIKIYHPKINPVVAKYFPYKAGISNFKKIEDLISDIYSNYKFTHVHAQTALTNGMLGLQISRKYKVPLITTVNGTDIDKLIYRNEQSYTNMREVLINSNAVTTPSIIIKRKVQERLKTPSCFIGRGIYLEQRYEKKSPLKQQYDNKFVILSVSKLIKTKGVDLNLIAISKLPNEIKELIKYIIIGEGPQEMELVDLVEELGLKENVEFLGYQNKEMVMEYMSFCDIFSLPSWQETFGLVYLEAMAHGKTVIGSREHGIDGIISHKVNGLLVKEKDTDHLTQLISFSVNNYKQLKKFGERAKKEVEDHYTWEKIAIKNKELYDQVKAIKK